MFSSQSLVSFLSAVTLVLAAPSHHDPHFVPIIRRDGTTAVRPNGYIVQLKPSATFAPANTATDGETTILHEYPALHAFAGVFSPTALEALQNNPDVKRIEEDTVGGVDHIIQQTNAPWGLQRISSFTKINSTASHALNYKYSYDKLAGTGVDIYVVDSGTIVVEVSTFEIEAPKQVLTRTTPNLREGQFGERCVAP
jgi:Peptidase inhibitor I9